MERLKCDCGRIFNVGIATCPMCGRPSVYAQTTNESLPERKPYVRTVPGSEREAALMDAFRACDQVSADCGRTHGQGALACVQAIRKLLGHDDEGEDRPTEEKWDNALRKQIAISRIEKAQKNIQRIGQVGLAITMSQMQDIYDILDEARFVLFKRGVFLEVNRERFKP